MDSYPNHFYGIIAAIAEDGAIGKDGSIPWHLSHDLRRFSQLTMGMTVIMGRKTWDSLPNKKLPGRTVIVVTRRQWVTGDPHVRLAKSPADAAALLGHTQFAWVAGGASLYEYFMPRACDFALTFVDTKVPGADTHFPVPQMLRHMQYRHASLTQVKEQPAFCGQPSSTFERYKIETVDFMGTPVPMKETKL